MNSLPFSINTYNPTSRFARSFARRSLHSNNNNTVESPSSSSVKFVESEQINKRLTSSADSVRRREVLGLSFCFSLTFLNPQLKSFAADENSQCEFVQAPNGLAYCDKVVGTGPEAVKGQLIKAHYVGKLEDGKVFDSSYNRGKPLTFRVGVGEVIKGWDQGILGGEGIPPMLAGGKRKLKIPPELAYGMRGAGCRGGSCIIPPNSVLLFDVEFVGKAA